MLNNLPSAVVSISTADLILIYKILLAMWI